MSDDDQTKSTPDAEAEKVEQATQRVRDSAVEQVQRVRAGVSDSCFLAIFHRDGVDLHELKPGHPIVVGRKGDFSIADSSLSKKHARFEIVGKSVLVEDLGSLNGVWSGGKQVFRAELEGECELRLGAVVVLISRLGGEPLADQLDILIARAATEWGLSPKPRAVLELVALGKTNKEIANHLGREERTVEAHMAKLFEKSGAENRTDLVSRLWRLSRKA
jgi:DNA-binding CsgD family transcriptional regulator